MHLTVPDNFSLDLTVRSSRIAGLPPFIYDPARRRLDLVLCHGGEALDVAIADQGPGRPLLIEGPPALGGLLRSMLRLDEDLGLLYQMTDGDAQLSWVRASGAGRLLRSPTAYEDLVKVLLLGGASLRQAGLILRRLCDKLGPRTRSGRRGFPSAQAMADRPLRFYEDLGAGRLARPLLLLARRCHSGALYPEALRRGDPSTRVPHGDLTGEELEWLLVRERDFTERLRALLVSLAGFSARAADLMLPLLGCYLGVPLPLVRDRPAEAKLKAAAAPRTKICAADKLAF